MKEITMTINNATVEQINVALLDIDKRIKALNADNEAIKSLQNSVKTIKSSLNEITTGMAKTLTVNGKTYNGSEDVDAGVQIVENGGTGVTTQEEINKAFIGNLELGESDVTDGTEFVSSWANDNGFSEPEALNKPYKRQFIKVWNYIKDKISSVLGLTKDNYGGKANTAGTADKATNADIFKTLDPVNGDELQIGSGSSQHIINAKHAATADAFSTTYTSMITPAQAAAMKSYSTIWPLSYNKNYLQTVSVTWDDYSSHTFPAGAAGMFFPGYSSNGGTLILINYPSSRMLYNVWIDSNRWSGWHYIDLTAISYT